MKPRSLYIHVPFCTRRCSYCDFAVQATSSAPVDSWIDAIAGELELLARERGWDRLELDTVYIGGGTPSLLGGSAMAKLRDRLAPRASWSDAAEWTCEANPESFTTDLASGWRAAGVNRISLGVQTFHEPSLRWMGRLHGPEGPPRAIAAARAAGFENLSVDLIFGLPARLERDWGRDLEMATALEPEHISLYGLTAEPGAPLGRWVGEGREVLADEDMYADQYLLAHQELTRAGFEHYEVSNFALPKLRSRHNSAYWTGAPYAALGPGAHAYSPPMRCWNLRGWDAYRKAIESGKLPTEGQEQVSDADAALESIWLTLRTDRGYPLENATGARAEILEEWVRRGWAERTDTAVRLTAEGWLRLDRLALDLAGALAHDVDGRSSSGHIPADPNAQRV